MVIVLLYSEINCRCANVGLFLDRSSTLLSSTRTRSVELYSFSRMSLRLYIDSRVANAALVFLFEKARFQEQKTERVPRWRFRAARHTKKTSRARVRVEVCEVFFRSDMILDTAAVSKCQLIYEGI